MGSSDQPAVAGASVELATVNGCRAAFIVPASNPPAGGYGLLIASMQTHTLLERFPDWTEGWAAAGYLVACYDWRDNRYVWGADVGIETVDALFAQARDRWEVRERPAVCGTSRGGLNSLVWAHRHRGLPICWFGTNPVMELRTFYHRPGRAAELNEAYGISNKAELESRVCPRVNPVKLAPELAWLPMRTWQGRDDRVTPPEDLATFEAAVRSSGGNHTTVLGPGGHARPEGPRPQFDVAAQLAFVQSCEPSSMAQGRT